MISKKLSLVSLVLVPILVLFLVFLILYFFSNFKANSDFVYFDNLNYTGNNYIVFVNNKLVVVDSGNESFQSERIKNCNQTNGLNIIEPICSVNIQNSIANLQESRVFVYDSNNDRSKQIDLENAKNLVLIPELKNENGESFEAVNCNVGGSFLFGYNNNCREGNKVIIKNSNATKQVDLEAPVYTKLFNRDNPGGLEKNIFWIKK